MRAEIRERRSAVTVWEMARMLSRQQPPRTMTQVAAWRLLQQILVLWRSQLIEGRDVRLPGVGRITWVRGRLRLVASKGMRQKAPRTES